MVILLYLLLSDWVASQLSALLRSAFLHPAVLLLSRCVCVIVSFVRGFVSISLRDAPLWAQVKAIWRGPYIRRGRWYKEAARVFKRGPNLCATQQHLKPLLQESSSASNLRGNDTLHPRVHREADKFPRSAGPRRGAIEWMSTWTCARSAVCHTSAVKTLISSKETINTEMNHQNIINYSFSPSNVFV